MATSDTTSPEFFEERYRNERDPWNFEHSEYEQDRFERIAQALAQRRYRHALEPGCSIGTLTVRLATLCDRITAFDLSPTAVTQARERCAGYPHVELRVAALDVATPVEAHDLIILSELGYYFSPEAWEALATDLASRMQQGTVLLASHWLGHSEEHVQHGDEVHRTLRAVPHLRLEHEERRPGFRLDRFVRI